MMDGALAGSLATFPFVITSSMVILLAGILFGMRKRFAPQEG